MIIFNGAVEEVPKAWLDQRAEGGRLVAPVAEGGVRRARIYTRSGGKTAFRHAVSIAKPRLCLGSSARLSSGCKACRFFAFRR